MSRENAIQLEGTVVDMPSTSVVRVALDNGHQLVMHAGRATRAQFAELRCGDRVQLEVSPYDFSSGRFRGKVAQV